MSDPTVSLITPHVRQLEAPSELRRLQGWLIWRLEQHEGEPKPRKVPYYASGQKRYGKQGSAEDRAKLVTFGAAKEAAARRGYDGVGLALLPDWGITALDFDDCIDDRGGIPPEIEAIVGSTYSEYSPSGHGIRAFVRGQLGNHKDLKNPSFRWNFETFATNGFVTFTGHPLLTTEVLGLEDVIADAGPNVIDLCARRFAHSRENPTSSDPLDTFEPPLGLSVTEMEALLSDLDPSMGRDDWIRVGMGLHHETEGDDTGFTLWDEWSSGGVQYPGTEALQAQWDSFERREIAKRPVTMGTVKNLSAEARAERGLPPRISEALQRVADAAHAQLETQEPVAVVGTPSGFTGKFPIIPAGQFSNRAPPKWIIKGLLPEADFGMIYGASGSGKSFIILDMALAIARGVDWRGLRTRQLRVMVIVAEGGGGVSSRLKAYEMHNEIDMREVPLGIMHSVPNFLVEDDITEVMGSLVAAGGADLIIIDTLAQVTPGANENSGEDMGRALRHARLLREVTGAMVVIVHHSGKDVSRGARGWSGIKAAADVELEVLRSEESVTRVLRTSKQKDGRDDLRWGFDLDEVIVGLDFDGDDVTSLVCVEAEIPVFDDEEMLDTTEVEQAIVNALNDSMFGDAGSGLSLGALIVEVQGRLENAGAEPIAHAIETLLRSGVIFEASGVLDLTP